MIKKFDSREEALAAGFRIDLGNGEWSEGGETMPRERYAKLMEAIGRVEKNAPPFKLPDFRDKPPS